MLVKLGYAVSSSVGRVDVDRYFILAIFLSLRGKHSSRQLLVVRLPFPFISLQNLILGGRSPLLALKMMTCQSAAGCWQSCRWCTPAWQSKGNPMMTVITAPLLLGESRILNMQLVWHLTTGTNRISLSEVGLWLKRQHTHAQKQDIWSN